MGSSQSSQQIQATTQVVQLHPLLETGEFRQNGLNFIPINPLILNCEINRTDWRVDAGLPSASDSIQYGCILTPAMDLEITRLKVAYPQLKIVPGCRLFVQNLPEYVTCARVTLYLIQNPYDQETTVVGWRLAAAAMATVGRLAAPAEQLQ